MRMPMLSIEDAATPCMQQVMQTMQQVLQQLAAAAAAVCELRKENAQLHTCMASMQQQLQQALLRLPPQKQPQQPKQQQQPQGVAAGQGVAASAAGEGVAQTAARPATGTQRAAAAGQLEEGEWVAVARKGRRPRQAAEGAQAPAAGPTPTSSKQTTAFKVLAPVAEQSTPEKLVSTVLDALTPNLTALVEVKVQSVRAMRVPDGARMQVVKFVLSTQAAADRLRAVLRGRHKLQPGWHVSAWLSDEVLRAQKAASTQLREQHAAQIAEAAQHSIFIKHGEGHSTLLIAGKQIGVSRAYSELTERRREGGSTGGGAAGGPGGSGSGGGGRGGGEGVTGR
jgi:hypothetical protein